MADTIIALAWFIGLAGFANILQYFFAITYQRHWLLFVSLFLAGATGIYYTTSLQIDEQFINVTGLTIAGFVIFSYIIFLSWWGKSYRLKDMYRPESVPVNYQQLLLPNAPSALSKVLEILIQDLVLVVIVKDLLSNGYSYTVAGLSFAAIVFVVHIPSPKVLGPVYGYLLMMLATVFACFIPFLIGEFALGFYYVFTLHVSVYMLLLGWSRWMQSRQEIKIPR